MKLPQTSSRQRSPEAAGFLLIKCRLLSRSDEGHVDPGTARWYRFQHGLEGLVLSRSQLGDRWFHLPALQALVRLVLEKNAHGRDCLNAVARIHDDSLDHDLITPADWIDKRDPESAPLSARRRLRSRCS